MRNKSTIAKLLSEEDINVVQKQASTASFDVKNRELVLPIWKDEMSDNIADLLVCHEIGHALYTSEDMLDKMIKRNIEKTFVNVIEDARIEKMVQQKYAGSRSVFLKGYKELIDKDFFGTKSKDISKLNLIDRINLYFKGTTDTPFSAEEKIWVEKVNNVKTEDDVLNLSEELYKWLQGKKKSQDEEQENLETQLEVGQSGDGSEEGQEQSQGSGSEESNDDGEEQSGSSTESDQDSDETDGTQEVNSGGSEGGQFSGNEFVATTDNNYNEKSQEMRDMEAKDRDYSFIPKVKLDKTIISSDEIFKLCRENYKCTESEYKLFVRKTTEEFQNIKKDSKKVISYMVKEFEMKKSANQYKRASTAKTGSLDMGVLHSYKFNDDLFKKVTTLPGATNHGMVMFLDWSGSMCNNMPTTLKQLFNLVWFCNRVKIPFEVYAFTDAFDGNRYYDNNPNTLNIQDFKSGDLVVGDVKLLNFLSNKMNKKDQDEMMDYLWKMAARWVGFRDWRKDGYPMNPPKKLTLGGTPFNHAIVAAMELLPKYKKKTGVEKLNAVFLTDGASHKISNKYIVDGDIDTQSETKAFDSYSNDKIMVITDPVTNTTITEEEVINKISRYSYDSSSQTTMLLQLLKKRVPDTSILGFYVAGSGKAGYVKKEIIMKEMNCSWEEASEYYKEINKNKVLVSKQKGYDEYYILPGGAKLDIESGDLNVEVGASKANLKRAFVKASKGKVTSRILLNKFIQRVA